jgi:hypothetical protein
MAENSITRITDLPMMSGGNDNFNNSGDIPNTTYTPLNAHPNPYIGGTEQQLPLPQNTQFGKEQRPEHRLEQRHVQFDTTQYNDEQVHVNYIPQRKINNDFVRDYEEQYDDDFRKNESKKYRKTKLEQLIAQLHMPILIAILYFIFSMPIFNTFLNKNFSFLQIYDLEGNFNFYGILFKSILFGGCYYLWTGFIEYFNE